jgi:acyl-CoA thioesterase I
MAARQAGRRGAIPGERRRSLGPYGAVRRLFNAIQVVAALLGARTFRLPAPSPRVRGNGWGERHVAARTLAVVAPLMLVLTLAGMPAAARAPVIVDFGDSLTAGYGLMPDEAFPAQLEAWLRRHGIAARVVNAGVSGDTTTDGLARLDWALADKPDLVILALGANDALRGIDPATVRDNLDKMIDKIAAAHGKVLLLGMLAPPNWGEGYDRAFDRIFPDLAHAHQVALYPFFLEGVAMKPDLNQPDGLHPNARGVAVLVGHIGPVVAGLLAGRSGAAG